MKIAITANFDKELNLNTKGGSELFTFLLANELSKRASIDSIDVYGMGKNYFNNPKIIFRGLLPEETREYIKKNQLLNQLYRTRTDFFTQFEAVLAVKLFRILMDKNYDLIHNNSTSAAFNSLSSLLKIPIIATLHTNVESPSIIIPESLGFLTQDKDNNFFVAISNFQKKSLMGTKLKIVQTVYNGIDVSNYAFSSDTPNNKPGFWIGRISQKHNKGLREAILAVNKLNKGLTIAPSIDDPAYYDKTIKPILTEKTKIITSEITIAQKNEYYKNSSFLLYPIMWEEPFGLIFLESMASGTPVIAFARGAVPEIIKDGETGYIVNPSDTDIRGDWIVKKTGIGGLCEAVERIYAMPAEQYRQMRRNCRKRVEENFTVQRMVDEYEQIYSKVLEGALKL